MAEQADIPELLTIKEAMAALRIGRTRMYELINAGLIHVVRLGPRSPRIPRIEIQRAMTVGLQ